MIGKEQVKNKTYQADLEVVLESGLPFERLHDKSVLITGATGLIGSFLVDVLMALNERENLRVHVTAMCRNEERARRRFEAYTKDSLFTILAKDICEPFSSCDGWDYVVHGASNAHPLAFSREPVETMKANLTGTMNLLEQQRESSRRGRLLFLSTGEIYGEYCGDGQDAGFRETDMGYVDCMAPRACYPESKRAAETLCASYGKEYGLDVCVARLCYIYGATVHDENSRADAQFLRNVLAGQDIVMKSDGLQYRSYCYVADAAAAIFTILLHGKAGEAYNVADRNSDSTIRGYAEALSDAAGVKVVFENPSDVEKQGYSKVGRAVLDPSKLEGLGWGAKVGLRDGVGRMVGVLC